METIDPYRLISDIEIENMPPLSWLIEGVLPESGLAILYGQPGAGKTFVALDMALCVGIGKKWQGRPTAQGPVVYISGEGIGGLPQRVSVWKIANDHRNEPANVYFLKEAVPLRDLSALRRLKATLHEMPSPPKLIVIDTFARSLAGGEENSAKDVGEFIRGIDEIRNQSSAAVLLVHHSGKSNKSQERGSSSLRAAADTSINVEKKDQLILLRCVKQKEAPEFSPIPLKLSLFVLDDGESSCVVSRADFEPREASLSVAQLNALRVLGKFGYEGGTSGEWREKSGLAQKTFYRAVEILREKKLVTRPGVQARGEKYTLTAMGRDAVSVTSMS